MSTESDEKLIIAARERRIDMATIARAPICVELIPTPTYASDAVLREPWSILWPTISESTEPKPGDGSEKDSDSTPPTTQQSPSLKPLIGFLARSLGLNTKK